MARLLSLKGVVLAALSALVVTGSLIGGGVALAANTNSVLAQAPGTPAPGPFSALREQILENFYQRALLVVQDIQLRIDLGNKIADAVQIWINTLNSQGKDTTALQSALASFKSKLATAQSEHDQASSILSTHNGFNGSGKVIDVSAARQTLLSARDHLRSAHEALTNATRDLREAVRAWRLQNRPQSQPQNSTLTPS